MATLLSDTELKKLLGTVILEGDIKNIRPNSYIVRIGCEGEFINTGKPFQIGEAREGPMGLVVPAGHSVGIMSHERLDFSLETVGKIFPGSALHAFIAPTTDLSREGVIAPSTQVDAGFKGTLNWTITNTSSQDRCYMFKENIFRLTILKLEPNESPEHYYSGDYQEQDGYVSSRRKGAPVGMKQRNWIGPYLKEGPEELLNSLIKSGFPWSAVGTRFKSIDEQLCHTATEIAAARDSLDNVNQGLSEIEIRCGQVIKQAIENEMNGLETKCGSIVKNVIEEKMTHFENKWLLKLGGFLFAAMGVAITVFFNENAFSFIKKYSAFIGIVVMTVGFVALYIRSKRKA